jgi:ribosomal protein S18 acetylase RimI-like enzyme
MRLIRRRYQNEEDYWRIRAFLRRLFVLHEGRGMCWPVYRWDYWRWHVNANIWRFSLEAAVFLWETGDGQLAAVLHPNGPGEAILQVHPAYRSPDLEVEMMNTAETQFAVSHQGGERLALWAHQCDAVRQDLLARRGFSRGPGREIHLRRSLEGPAPDCQPPAGYTVRALGDDAELLARGWLSWKTLHPDQPADRYAGWQWYHNIQRAPLYRRDLDLVAVAPDDELAAFCTIWFDDVTRTAACEPVGVHPAHRSQGLGEAIVVEGMRRAARLGATLCTAIASAGEANALYAALGFAEHELSEPWVKTW